MNVVRDVRRGDVSSVLPMIAKKARRAWKGLPPHTREWVTLEDLIADGVSFTVTHAAKRYKENRNTKFSTYLFGVLDNYFIYRTAPYRTESGNEFGTFSMQRSVAHFTAEDGSRDYMPLDQYLFRTRKTPSHESDIVQKIDIERQFLKVYGAASMNLRIYLIRWFFQPRRQYKTVACSKLTEAKKEFRKLASAYIFSPEMCRVLLGSQTLRLSLSATISKQFCTIRRVKRDGTTSSVEKYLHEINA